MVAGVAERVAAGAPVDWVHEVLTTDPIIEGRGSVRYVQLVGPDRWLERHERGSAGHLAAVERGAELLPPRIPAPATTEVVERFEAELGHPLPSVLRRLWLEVANGGFGPAYAVLGVDRGQTDDNQRTAVDWWRGDHLRTPTGVPLVRTISRGCGIYDLVEADDAGRVWIFDPNKDEDEELEATDERIVDVLADWLSRPTG